MIHARAAKIIAVKNQAPGLTEIEIDLAGDIRLAVNLDEFTGQPAVGDTVVVNTTAMELGLGSGGRHFVIWNLAKDQVAGSGAGHLMKLRYTPFQRAGLSVEEPDSPHHEVLRDADDLEAQPVIACGLHSQLLPAAAAIRKTAPDLRVAYVMTDGGALPAGFSSTARWLREKGYIRAVISAGQAFGGDLEAVNIYSALAAAKWVVGADVTIVAMGPGIAGTGTVLGHTGMEQGQIINAVYSLGGRPVAPLRIGLADRRKRHRGLSHHSVSALTLGALAPALIPLPELKGSLADLGAALARRLDEAGISARHEIRPVAGEMTLAALTEIIAAGGPAASTMGRGHDEEPAFFLAAGAAGIAAASMTTRNSGDTL